MINQFSTPLKVTRYSRQGKYVDGYFKETQSESFNILACVQPMDGDDLLLLTEAERSKQMIVIWTQSELFTVSEAQKRKADIVTYRGRKFEIHKVKYWGQLIPHFECVAVDKTDLTEED